MRRRENAKVGFCRKQKDSLTEEVYLFLTFSIIRLHLYIRLNLLKRGNCGLKNFRRLASWSA